MMQLNRLLAQLLNKLRHNIAQRLLFALLFFTHNLFAACAMENYTAIDFRSVTVPEQTKTGEIIQTRNAIYSFFCTPNSQRADTANFSLTRPSGKITFYRNTQIVLPFNGVDIRITITDHLGKKHVIEPSTQATDIYSITDNDLKTGFSWDYTVQLDLIRTNQPLPTTRVALSNYMQIANFGFNRNLSYISRTGRLYVRAGFTTQGNNCHVTMPNLVTLPNISLFDLDRQPVRSTFKETDFNISVHCQDPTTASIVFYDVYASGDFLTEALTPTPNSSAKGVQLAIKNNNRILNISSERYSRSSLIDGGSFSIISWGQSVTRRIEKNTTSEFQFQIAYYKTSNIISSGTIGGAATVLITYN